MSTYEKLTLVVSGGSVVLALIAIYVSVYSARKSNSNSKNALDKTDVQNMIAMSQLELAVSQGISNSKTLVSDMAITMSPLLAKKNTSGLSAEETMTFDIQQRVFDSRVESNINAYEEACTKYLDGKIDRVRFHKNYNVEIRQLVEKPSLHKYFNSVSSNYKAIIKVYTEWNNFEK